MFEKFRNAHLGANPTKPGLSRGDRIRKLMKLRDDLIAAQRRAAEGVETAHERPGSHVAGTGSVPRRLEEMLVGGEKPRRQ